MGGLYWDLSNHRRLQEGFGLDAGVRNDEYLW
jgi:hypothetical protein